jgi:hypothetical protein
MVPVPEARDVAAGELLVLTTRIALGLMTMAGEGLAEVAGRVVPGLPARAPWPLRVGAGAAIGLGFAAQRRTLAAAGRLAVAVEPLGGFVRPRLEPWYRKGVAEQRHNRELADRFWRLLVAQVVAAVLDEVDLDAVADRIDVERVVARLDLDRVAARLDVNAIVDRVDMPRLARHVIDDVEMREAIRESTSGLADESIEALRVQGMDADRRVNRLVDRLLGRHDARRTQLGG